MNKMNSLLSTKELNHLIKIAKINKTKFPNSFQPVIFIRAENSGKNTIVVPLEFPENTYEAKVLTFSLIGKQIRSQLGNIKEAVFISDAYYLKLGKNDHMIGNRVSEDPRAKEALVLVGRDDSKKSVFINQTYEMKNGKLKFLEAIKDTDNKSQGLVDYLFMPELDELINKNEKQKYQN